MPTWQSSGATEVTASPRLPPGGVWGAGQGDLDLISPEAGDTGGWLSHKAGCGNTKHGQNAPGTACGCAAAAQTTTVLGAGG